MRLSTCFGLWLMFSAAPLSAAEAGRGTVQFTLGGVSLEGRPLAWSSARVELLARDGRWLSFSPAEAQNARQSSSAFTSLSVAEMKSRLSRELGRDFELTSTGHYIVAHPKGRGRAWSDRFEDLYRSFVHYFSVRGFNVPQPTFPLVAIVFHNQDEFFRYAEKDGSKINPQVLGYYSPVSNRVSLFDVTGGNPDDENWYRNADTIIHEATHQTAFNTGIHNRFTAQPKWLVEGLATMFEAPGVWNSRRRTARTERFNQGRLADFRHFLPQRTAGALAEFLASDDLFARKTQEAYANAWAFSFYLVESRPKKYSELLLRVSKRPDFRDYTPQERLADFTAVFGSDLRLLENQFLRFMEELP